MSKKNKSKHPDPLRPGITVFPTQAGGKKKRKSATPQPDYIRGAVLRHQRKLPSLFHPKTSDAPAGVLDDLDDVGFYHQSSGYHALHVADIHWGDEGRKHNSNETAISKESAEPAFSHLWVYEPADLADISLEDVHTIWQYRDALCGSREAAAEVLALLEVDAGIVESYLGWEAYMQREEIQHISLCEEMVETAAPVYTRLDVQNLSLHELNTAWQRRPGSFTRHAAPWPGYGS